ncbi:glycosyltransferase family 25 protein [Mesorhizobium sp. VNQ89]|uniref:glycosyltransferase family 25 protein n=1 Tax=Mesorhizobium quangtriensis TaxID=3157709 RepID=UPI0032B71879
MINLDRSPERLAFMAGQLDDLGIAFIRLPATEGASIPDAEFDRFANTYMRPITRSELGCLTSHIRAWQHCIERDQPVLVLEDDSFLSERLAAFLAEFDGLGVHGVINLETRGYRKRISKSPLPAMRKSAVRLYRLFVDRGGTAGYIVTPGAARNLVELSKTYAAPSDAFIDLSGVPRLQADPGLVATIFVDRGRRTASGFKTTITKPNRRQRQAVTLRHPTFKLRRLTGYFSMMFRKVATMGIAVTRTVAVCPTILARAENRSA